MSLLTPAERYLVDIIQEHGIRPPRLRLVDVGVSGGIYPVWRRWGERLSGLGVDVIVDEINQLRSVESNPAICYLAARIAAPSVSVTRTTYALHRSQAYLATTALQKQGNDFRALWRETMQRPDVPAEANYSNVADPKADPFFGYYLERFSGKAYPELSTRIATLDELIAEVRLDQPDILKIDTDGYDFDVLRGAERALTSCLAVEIEVQFHGPVGPQANVFSNIDGFLRDRGFSIFSLETFNYARSALPRPFLYDIPAQTDRGPIAWGDALFVRDIADPRYAGRFAFQVTDDQRRNLAFILDLYGLEDAAAELILGAPGMFDIADDTLLDFLAAKVHGEGTSYATLTADFMADPVHFRARETQTKVVAERPAHSAFARSRAWGWWTNLRNWARGSAMD